MTSDDPEAPNTGSALRKRKYSDEQRGALVRAREGGASATRVAELARAGQLRDDDGRRIPGFEIPPSSIRDIVRRARRRRVREGMAALEVHELPHRDAIEILRVQLVTLVAGEVKRLKRRQRAHGNVDALDLQKTARALIDLARIPAPQDERPPNENVPDQRPGRAGLKGVKSSSPRSPAGSLMRAFRGEPDPNRPPPPSPPIESPADYAPTVADEEPPVVDPGTAIAEQMRQELEAAARSNGDPDPYGA